LKILEKDFHHDLHHQHKAHSQRRNEYDLAQKSQLKAIAVKKYSKRRKVRKSSGSKGLIKINKLNDLIADFKLDS